jgi:hypothetical protein
VVVALLGSAGDLIEASTATATCRADAYAAGRDIDCTLLSWVWLRS